MRAYQLSPCCCRTEKVILYDRTNAYEQPHLGPIDEVRITTGVARYASDSGLHGAVGGVPEERVKCTDAQQRNAFAAAHAESL